jgi:hypothetical protein
MIQAPRAASRGHELQPRQLTTQKRGYALNLLLFKHFQMWDLPTLRPGQKPGHPQPFRDPPMSSDPFSTALARHDPSAEPYANMVPERLRELMEERRAANDQLGCWTVERHLAEKLPPVERFISDTQTTTQAFLMQFEASGQLPAGWTARNALALLVRVQRTVLLDTEPYAALTPAESIEEAHEVGERWANDVVKHPERIEALQAEIESTLWPPRETP